MATTATTVDEVAAGLERLERALPPSDGIKWFTYLYGEVTKAIAGLFDAGDFEAPDFMGRLVVDFGNAFFAVVDGTSPPDHAWQPVFDRRHDRDIAPVQFAIAGLNAHVGYQLPVGLAEQWRSAGLEPGASTPQHRDYDRVNATIGAVEPRAKRHLLTGAVKEVDRIFDGADDVVAVWSVEAARESAWAHGAAVWRLWDEPVLLQPYLDALEHTVGLVSRLLLVPTAVD